MQMRNYIMPKMRKRKPTYKLPSLRCVLSEPLVNDPEITNHVLWPTELKRQVGKLTTSRRYNQVPLLRSSPGGFRGSMPCRTYPGAKVDIIFYFASVFLLLG